MGLDTGLRESYGQVKGPMLKLVDKCRNAGRRPGCNPSADPTQPGNGGDGTLKPRVQGLRPLGSSRHRRHD